MKKTAKKATKENLRPEPLLAGDPMVSQAATKSEMNEKRMHLPGVIVSGKCSWCSEIATRDLGEFHLSYPPAGQPFALDIPCLSDKCQEEAFEPSVRVILLLSVSLIALPSDTPVSEDLTQ